MPFPDSERIFFENNPLFEVVCQLRFPPILRIATGEPAEFQDRIRAQYPKYRKEKTVVDSEEVESLLRRLGIHGDSEHLTHKFLTEDEQRHISLARDFVAVTEHDYRRWERFRDEVDRMREAVEEVYEPSGYERVGLRYRDAIDREELGLEDRPWSELLNSSLVGLLGEPALAGRVENTRTEVQVRLDEPPGARCQLRHGFAQKSDSGVTVYLVDADFYTQQKIGGEDVLEALGRFNRIAGNLFRWAITDVLEEALEPRDLGHLD